MSNPKQPESMSPEETEEAFLDFIAREIETNPGSVVPITQESVERSLKLVEGVVVDLDEELPDDVTF